MSHSGSEWVKAGYYVSPSEREIVSIDREGGDLPGEAGERYYRLPLLLVMIAAPIMGAVYVVVLPIFGLGAIAWNLSERAVARVRGSRTEEVHSNANGAH